MSRIVRSDSFETHEPATAANLARPETDAALVAKSGRTDAVSAGIVRNGGERSGEMKETTAGPQRRTAKSTAAAAPDIQAAEANESIQRRFHVKAMLADEAAEQLDDSDELEGVADMRRGAKGAARVGRGAYDKVKSRKSSLSPSGAAKREKGKRTAAEARKKIQSRRTWIKARQAQVEAKQAAAAAKAIGSGTGKGIAAAVSSVAAPIAGILGGILCFVLAAFLASQLVSSLFGFWENEQSKQAVSGLPPSTSRPRWSRPPSNARRPTGTQPGARSPRSSSRAGKATTFPVWTPGTTTCSGSNKLPASPARPRWPASRRGQPTRNTAVRPWPSWPTLRASRA